MEDLLPALRILKDEGLIAVEGILISERYANEAFFSAMPKMFRRLI